MNTHQGSTEVLSKLLLQCIGLGHTPQGRSEHFTSLQGEREKKKKREGDSFGFAQSFFKTESLNSEKILRSDCPAPRGRGGAVIYCVGKEKVWG